MSRPRELIGIIKVVPLSDGLEAVCEKCKKILGNGEYAIGISDEDDQYFVEHDPSVECCGKERAVPLLYMDLDSAVREKDRIKAAVEHTGTLHGINLVEVPEDMRWSAEN